jgi:hypothetical protein
VNFARISLILYIFLQDQMIQRDIVERCTIIYRQYKMKILSFELTDDMIVMILFYCWRQWFICLSRWNT